MTLIQFSKRSPNRQNTMQTDNNRARNLSRHQYGTLKFIHDNHITLEYLRHAHANTLGSIAQHKWIAVRGPGEDAPVELTAAGRAELEYYTRATINERSHEGDLTDRCQRLLKYTRRLVAMDKTA